MKSIRLKILYLLKDGQPKEARQIVNALEEHKEKSVTAVITQLKQAGVIIVCDENYEGKRRFTYKLKEKKLSTLALDIVTSLRELADKIERMSLEED